MHLFSMGRTIRYQEIEPYLSEMKEKGVSEKARSRGQFLEQLKRAGGKVSDLPDKWKEKREKFIARHLAQYKKNRTRRSYLALIAWAYKPDKKP